MFKVNNKDISLQSKTPLTRASGKCNVYNSLWFMKYAKNEPRGFHIRSVKFYITKFNIFKIYIN